MVGYAEEELVNQPVTIVSPLTGTYQTVSGKPYSITEYDVQVMADTLAALFEKERSYAASSISRIAMACLYRQRLTCPC